MRWDYMRYRCKDQFDIFTQKASKLVLNSKKQIMMLDIPKNPSEPIHALFQKMAPKETYRVAKAPLRLQTVVLKNGVVLLPLIILQFLPFGLQTFSLCSTSPSTSLSLENHGPAVVYRFC